ELELIVGDLVHPGADRLAEQLAATLAADRVGDRPDRVGGIYEAERHRREDRPAARRNRRRARRRRAPRRASETPPRGDLISDPMPISMIVGPPNSGRLGEVVRRLRAQLDREPVLLVPRVADADRFERALCADGAPVTGVSIRTFAWLLEDLAAALALAVPPLLSAPERLALARAATRSAERPGFAPALVALIEELEAALIPPTELADAAAQAEGGEYEAELARLYAAYVGLRDRAGRADLGSLASAVLAQGQRLADAWGSRPLFVYGFDDLTRAQLELLRALSGAAEVTVAATY